MSLVHHTRPDDAAVDGWVRLPSGIEVPRLPLLDARHPGLFARLNYDEAIAVADREGARIISPETLLELGNVGLQLSPFLGTPVEETTIEHSRRHDEAVFAQLVALGWDGQRPVSGAGKHWVSGAPAGRSRLMGWDRDGAGPGKALWQPLAVAHNRLHYGDGTTTMLERGQRDDTDRPPDTEPAPAVEIHTVRIGDRGPLVERVQRIVAATADGVFGGGTLRRVQVWQSARGLVADGIFGAKSWRAAGYALTAPAPRNDPRAPACVAALRDANARWPGRVRVSDGVMGDARHQASPSDHNLGNAVDITHDPASGCTGDVIAELAIQDPRTTYVIWNRRIFNRARAAEGWRAYTGANGHTHHCHVSVRVDARDDDRPWGWAPA
jgi:hypothetical protein